MEFPRHTAKQLRVKESVHRRVQASAAAASGGDSTCLAFVKGYAAMLLAIEGACSPGCGCHWIWKTAVF